MAPHKQLSAWREKNEVSLRTAAKMFGAARSTICKIEQGTRWPDLEQAFAIEDETGIPARSWVSAKRKAN